MPTLSATVTPQVQSRASTPLFQPVPTGIFTNFNVGTFRVEHVGTFRVEEVGTFPDGTFSRDAATSPPPSDMFPEEPVHSSRIPPPVFRDYDYARMGRLASALLEYFPMTLIDDFIRVVTLQ